MDVLRILLLIAVLIGVYILPATVAAGALVRAVFGFTHSRRAMLFAALLSLPEVAYLLFGPEMFWHDPARGPGLAMQLLFYLTVAAALAGTVLWWRAKHELERPRGWIEPMIALALAAAWILSVDNWIVG